MISERWNVRIARPVEERFDFVADLRNEPQFNPDASNITRETPGPLGQGTVFTEDFRRIGKYRTTIERYWRPAELLFVARNPRADARVHFTFTAVGEGETDVSCTVEVRMKGATRLAEPMMGSTIRRQIRETRGPMLKAALERGAAR